MAATERSAELAVEWIQAWIAMDMDRVRRCLAPDFVHISPFGKFEDRDSYLAAVEPLARKSVMELVIEDVIATGDQAAIRFENRTQNGVVESCDWIRVHDGRIQEIRSFYDTARIREILSPDEQEGLDGSNPSS